MLLNRFFATLIVAVLCAPAGATSFDDAIEVIKAQLRDPDSAKFRNLTKAHDDPDGTDVCGEYNAKNAMGGYVGYRVFAVLDGELFMQSEGSLPMEKVRELLKTQPPSGDPKDPVFVWGFCLPIG